MKLRSILTTLLASATLMAVSGVASAAPYKLVGWYQRSSGGTLSMLLFKAGAAQGCPGPTYIQPCYNPAGPSPGGAWAASNGVATDIIAAGEPTWDWNGTTLTETGLFWGASAIGSSPNGSIVISDKFTNFTVTPGTTTAAATYDCVEGTFLTGVNANGCLNVDEGANTNTESSAVYNVGGSANCVNRTVGGDDVSIGNPRGLFTAAAGGGCDAVDGSLDYYNIVANPRFLILSTTPAIVVNPGDCYMFGRNGAGTPTTNPCAADLALAGVSYLILAPIVDTDGDGVIDSLDNCKALSNATQVDSNDDGFGNRCDGDLNNDGSTNAFDTPLYRAQVGQPSTPPTYNAADINASGAVNAFDTPLYRALIGSGTGPSGLCVNSSNVAVFPCPANP